MNLTILYWLLIGVMLLGTIGSFFPSLPGPSLILGSILIWEIATGFAYVGWPLIVIFVVLILSALVEWLGTYYGVKQAGASKWSQIGAMVGLGLGILGFLPALPFGGPLLGILLGPIVGAFVGEFLYRQDLETTLRLKQALKACAGVVIGSIVGNAIEGLLALAAVVIFMWSTWSSVANL
jgi:hypothetical protein